MSNQYKIDKSAFTAEELATYEALIAKAKVEVDPEAEFVEKADAAPETKPEEKEVDNMEDTKKSTSPELTSALERLATLEKSLEMKEFTEIAKKYAPLGEKEEELAQTLYEMKKSNEANYNAYIGILDKSLSLVEKSGIFAEIGKSAAGYSAATGAEGKAEVKAAEIMKSHPEMTRTEALAKAWEDPDLLAEYDSEYQA